jgi:hypothetical protein
MFTLKCAGREHTVNAAGLGLANPIYLATKLATKHRAVCTAFALSGDKMFSVYPDTKEGPTVMFGGK